MSGTRRRESEPQWIPSGLAFDSRNNSLNLVRLVLALSVLWAHSYPLTGNQPPLFNGEHAGTWAVYMFFCLSGYLITGSRLRNSIFPYLTHRIARIYPGFLVSLVVVAIGFAPIAYVHGHGTLDGFLTGAPTPLHFIYTNLGLNIREFGIGDTTASLPYPNVWNGSLWSLYYEFLCYLIIGGLLGIALLRRWPKLLVPLFLLSVLAATHADKVLPYFGGNVEIGLLLTLLPYFLGGASLYALGEWIPLTWWTALPAIAVFLGLVIWQGDWGPLIGAPLLTLFLMWLGAVLPSPQWIRRNDLSYGSYVYAFPSQQMVSVFGAAALGPSLHAILAAPITLALAYLSWRFVERPAMRAVRRAGTESAAPVGA